MHKYDGSPDSVTVEGKCCVIPNFVGLKGGEQFMNYRLLDTYVSIPKVVNK